MTNYKFQVLPSDGTPEDLVEIMKASLNIKHDINKSAFTKLFGEDLMAWSDFYISGTAVIYWLKGLAITTDPIIIYSSNRLVLVNKFPHLLGNDLFCPVMYNFNDVSDIFHTTSCSLLDIIYHPASDIIYVSQNFIQGFELDEFNILFNDKTNESVIRLGKQLDVTINTELVIDAELMSESNLLKSGDVDILQDFKKKCIKCHEIHTVNIVEHFWKNLKIYICDKCTAKIETIFDSYFAINDLTNKTILLIGGRQKFGIVLTNKLLACNVAKIYSTCSLDRPLNNPRVIYTKFNETIPLAEIDVVILNSLSDRINHRDVITNYTFSWQDRKLLNSWSNFLNAFIANQCLEHNFNQQKLLVHILNDDDSIHSRGIANNIIKSALKSITFNIVEILANHRIRTVFFDTDWFSEDYTFNCLLDDRKIVATSNENLMKYLKLAASSLVVFVGNLKETVETTLYKKKQNCDTHYLPMYPGIYQYIRFMNVLESFSTISTNLRDEIFEYATTQPNLVLRMNIGGAAERWGDIDTNHLPEMEWL